MKASVRWINRYLEPGDLATEQIDQILTFAGFPIDAREDLPGGDARLEVEITSNRGDCLSHIGLAREVAAVTGRKLKLPDIPERLGGGPAVSSALKLENTAPEACPRFTARVIRGVKVGPSPAWLREALEAVGQRSINNVVDVTNYLNFEFGQPCHVFDLAKLAGARLVVRWAKEGEPLVTLDGKKRTLRADELVVADAERAQSLAGVIGGGESEVSDATTDVVLEVATWDPVTVRRAARRHGVRTDASHRFERIVDPRTIGPAAARAAALIVEVAGGTVCDGVLDEGPAAGGSAERREIPFRPDRCRALMGVEYTDEEMAQRMAALEIEVERDADRWRCRVPAFRPDLEREVDLIEEVARTAGLDRVPIHERLGVAVKSPQAEERAARELALLLTGLGFFETVTFSFVRPQHAVAFVGPGLRVVSVDDERRAHEPALRPSLLPSLLSCRRANQDGGASQEGGIRLFETAATFAERDEPGRRNVERRRLALLMDVPGVAPGKAGGIEERQQGVRLIRGVVEAAVRAMAGAAATLGVEPGAEAAPGYEPEAWGEVMLDGQPLGRLGLVSTDAQRLFGIDVPMVAAELDLATLLAGYPPRATVTALPAFPAIERDLSLIVDEQVPWRRVREVVAAAKPDKLEDVRFVGTYRGKQTGPGKKSVTLRMLFRDPTRTLRHEEVDPQVESVIAVAREQLGATLRM